ncbi:hypothetical protein HYC85_017038 [Camellia sinensis]|uniref:Uncharacterized protein n=1 Tax=Camellia sinensis TaxID=4442 RepID=A0A7J7H1F9_CAMSI|nr:hypothetical protein HYC85_017038 [Camellia sinensis]
MSEIERERSEDIVRNNDGDGSDRRDDHRKKKQREHGFGGNFRKAKRVALFQFRKAEKQLHRKNKKGSNQSSSIPGCFGKRTVGVGGGGGYYCCFKQTPTLDSPVESTTSDPNSAEFTYELLRALIETNDFYSKECNTHLDIINTDEN